jgi:outer membrane receptor protein involved in Fe transport
VAGLLPTVASYAQTTFATVTGQITDQQGRVVPGTTIVFTSVHTNIPFSTQTNEEGIYRLVNLHPGIYRANVTRDGFKSIVKGDIELHVQSQVSINFELQVGSVTETVTVLGGAPLVNTESAAVSTVVDRQFVGNIPLNGRSLQSLITLVPGVVRTAANSDGQFSVNGQRASANYFTVDGTSANIGMRTDAINTRDFAGSLPALTTFGGTNNLISIDSLEEFRIQTSTFAAEFGRTPGGQISLVSRSGTNAFHGALFEYFRNDVLDVNDWFANRAGLEKPPMRQNHFGGVLGGPIIKNRMFFFFSYEGLRLRQPQSRDTVVPALRLRQNAPADVQLLLNAFPVPTGPEFLDATGNPTGEAPFTAVYSDPTSMNATSLRIDHTLSSRFTLFGRYNQTPSRNVVRLSSLNNAANLRLTKDDTRTLTLGATLSLTPRLHNEFRVNYSRVRATSSRELDNFGGAVPLTPSQVLPPVLAPNQKGTFGSFILSGFFVVEPDSNDSQRQLNLVNNLSYVVGGHQLKFGVDYRRLGPRHSPTDYFLDADFFTEADILTGTASFVFINASEGTRPLFTNFSAFAQDTWKITPRLTLTYGLRWDVNTAPTEADGKQPYIVQGLDDLATATVTLGTPLWKTQYNNLAPRVGVAYQLDERQGWETVLRGGFGLFSDLGTGMGADAFLNIPPFGASTFLFGVPYPLTPAQAAPPPLPSVPTSVTAFDPNLGLPYTYQWNVALEQGLGANQSLSLSYVAAVGRRLLDFKSVLGPLPGIPDLQSMGVVTNGATSDYHALQLQFQRRLSRGLQALASYTWSHAIDELSDERNFESQQPFRGNSSFDVRHVFSAAITYDVPSPSQAPAVKAVFGNWAVDTTIRAQSAYPFAPQGNFLFLPDGSFFFGRPNLIPGVPIYLDDPNVPGGRRVNRAAFALPPFGQQGNLGRNVIRGFGFSQVDLALRRTFPMGERVKLVFRAEAFNLFNHPNFGSPVQRLTSPLFGQATEMLGRGLRGRPALNSLYEVGGPRSMQLALRLEF